MAFDLSEKADFPSLYGVCSELFSELYQLCESVGSTAADLELTRLDLAQILFFFKQYPTMRTINAHLGRPSVHLSKTISEIWAKVDRLTRILAPVRLLLWQNRNLYPIPPELTKLFGRNIRGSVDTFPIYVHHPKDSEWHQALYQGKYKAPVLKVSSFRIVY